MAGSDHLSVDPPFDFGWISPCNLPKLNNVIFNGIAAYQVDKKRRLNIILWPSGTTSGFRLILFNIPRS